MSILTLWVDAQWPVSVFLAGTYLLTILAVFDSRPLRNRNVLVALGLFAFLPIWVGAQLLCGWTVYPEATRLGLLAVLSYLCVVFLTSRCEPRMIDPLRQAMLWFAFIVAIAGIVQVASKTGKVFGMFVAPDSEVATGPINYHNHWAAFVEAILPVALYYTFRIPERRWLYSAMVATLYASVIASASRSGTIICSIELLALLLVLGRGLSSSAAWTVSLVFLCVVTFTAVVGPEYVIERFKHSDLRTGRWELISPSLVMFREHFARGSGLLTWPIIFPQYAPIDVGTFWNQAHNDWLQWAVEGGAFYVTAWVGIAVIAVRQALRSVWAVGVLAVFCEAAVDYPFSRPALAAWVLSILGLSLSATAANRLRSSRR